MPLPFLAIASGAVNIGKKLFGGIKARKAKKKAKALSKLQKTDDQLAAFEAKLADAGVNLGSSTVSQSGNSLQIFKDLKNETREDGMDELMVRDIQSGGQRPPMPQGVMYAIYAFVAFVVLKALKIIK